MTWDDLTKSPPVAEHRFVCCQCGEQADTVQLFGSCNEAVVVRAHFPSRLTARVPFGAFDEYRRTIRSGDICALHLLDPEVASFFCPTCQQCYCANHWRKWDVFDDEDGWVWHDCIMGRCPLGHERMLED